MHLALADSVADNNLDGLDFDWEYPGAIDIPGVDAGDPNEGQNYLAFLQMVKRRLPAGKTLSIAIPAGYWYLKGFPIADMAKVVDYFIFMTYDLHGQWDYGNKWASPGCTEGNCLRSHVNITETENSLSMVTKAGAPAHKIFVGITSYGRSFKMEDQFCISPDCHFTSFPGEKWKSNAMPGECTNTSGYISDAELRQMEQDSLVMGELGDVLKYHDHPSNSDIMLYYGNWVAYMSPTTKRTRTEWIQSLNFGGVSDWAVDLERFHAEPGQADDEEDYTLGGKPKIQCTADYADLDAVANDAANIPSRCWARYILESLDTMLTDVMKRYDDVAQDYDGKFHYYADYVNELVDPQLQRWMAQVTPDYANETNTTGKGNRFFTCKYQDWGAQNWAYEGDCPVPQSYFGHDGRYNNWEIEFTLKDKAGFEKALQNELGMSPDWIKWGKYDPGYKCPSQSPKHNDDVCEKVWQMHVNFPMKADSITVPDPQKVIQAALPNISALHDQIMEAYLADGTDSYDGDELDAVDALSTPVFMLAQAVDSMENVKVIAKQMEELEKKRLILTIVSVVLLVLPMVGELGFEMAGFVQLARFAFVAGEIGNAAMTVADIIDNPEGAPFAIMGMLFGAAGSGMRLERGLEQAAAARRIMSAGDVAGIGKVFEAKSGLVQKVVSQCVR